MHIGTIVLAGMHMHAGLSSMARAHPAKPSPSTTGSTLSHCVQKNAMHEPCTMYH